MSAQDRDADGRDADGWGAAPAGVNVVQRRAARRLLLGDAVSVGALGWRASGRAWEEAVEERGLVGRWTTAAHFCDPSNATVRDVQAGYKRLYGRAEYWAGVRRSRRAAGRGLDLPAGRVLARAV